MKKSERERAKVMEGFPELMREFSKIMLEVGPKPTPPQDGDIKLACELIAGRPTIGGVEYLVDETAARQALARLLRSDQPLDRKIRLGLAGLFNPDPNLPIPRTLKFGRRNRTTWLRDAWIAHQIGEATKQGLTLDEAIREAAKLALLSERQIWTIWGEYQKTRKGVAEAMKRRGP